MRYGSVCAGIEAASVAWHPLGWRPAFFSEIDPFPCAVLAHHYPAVPNFGDMTKFKDWPDATIDVLAGGTPCQAFSVAGLRGGLADPRGNLTLTYLAIVERYRPERVVWENVPGVLSDRSGAFGAFLGGLAKLGYGWAYRILDAQYFGLAQRRKRVFVVGSVRGWASAAAVLFERESLFRNSPPRRKAGQRIASSLTSGSNPGSNAPGRRREDDDNTVTHALRAEGFDASEDGTGRGIPLLPDVCPTLCSNGNNTGGNRPPGTDGDTVKSLIPVVMSSGQANAEISEDLAPTLNCLHEAPIAFEAARSGFADVADPIAANQSRTYTREGANNFRVSNVAIHGIAVRRLTPRECERLQGFPDDYTLIPYRGKPAADGPRYKALGNSMAVPVMRWIGRRLESTRKAQLEVNTP